MMKKIEDFIQKYHMIQSGDTIVTGVSGGADSICLLFALLKLKEKLHFHVIVCHINHGIRGEQADADERFVREICREQDIPCRIFHENVELIAKNRKQSLEEAGREVRRKAFEEVCAKAGGTKIATAHHQNDGAETLLMNLCRGTGLQGMCAIRPVSGMWIRPLLCMTRREIEECMKEEGIPFCHDETNGEDTYTRNRIRHQVIPLLETQVNVRAVPHLYEASLQAQEIWEYLALQAEESYRICVEETESGGMLLKKDRIDGLPFILQKLVAKKALERAAGSRRDLSAAHVDAVLDLFQGQVGRIRHLPYQLTARRVYAGVALGRTSQTEAIRPRNLKVPGTTFIPERSLCVHCKILERQEKFSEKELPQKTYTKWFDYDIIKNSLLIRTREAGDFLVIDKKGSRQKLKAYFINEKIPREERDHILLIADAEQIIWIPGRRMNSAYQVGENTKKILEIKITEEKADVRDNSGANI